MGSNLIPIDLGGPIIDFNSDGTHACAVLASNEVKCWGNNFFGQLGQGSRTTLGDNPGEMGPALLAINIVW